MKEHILTNYPEYYPHTYEFLWAFCRYFWEAHPILPDYSMDILEKLDGDLIEMV